LRWPLTLQPKEKRKFEIQYQIEYPPTLVVEMKRNRARDAEASPAAPSPPAAAPRRAHDLKEDIQELEMSF
jgi:hypothetical protein